MTKRINFELKENIVTLSGACFWYWNSFYSFLDSCGVPKSFQQRYPREAYNKYQVMRNILGDLEERNQIEIINNIISNFFKLRIAIDRDKLDEKKAKQLLKEFRELVGTDPIENEVKKRAKGQAREEYQRSVDDHKSKQKRLEVIIFCLSLFFLLLPLSEGRLPPDRGTTSFFLM